MSILNKEIELNQCLAKIEKIATLIRVAYREQELITKRINKVQLDIDSASSAIEDILGSEGYWYYISSPNVGKLNVVGVNENVVADNVSSQDQLIESLKHYYNLADDLRIAEKQCYNYQLMVIALNAFSDQFDILAKHSH